MPPTHNDESTTNRSKPAYPTRETVNYRKGKRNRGPVKRHHAWLGIVVILAWIVPPLGVAARFGIGLDFFINVFWTALAYIPGHIHYFWIINIRNNHNKRHSPDWAIRLGLVKDYRKTQQKQRKWAGRYADDGTVGGESYYAQQRWEQQDVIVDPVTGETTRDPDAIANQNKSTPWSRDPEAPSTRDWDDDLQGRPVNGSNSHTLEKPPRSSVRRPGTQRVDSVTGAVIDEGGLSPSGSNPSVESTISNSTQEKPRKKSQRKLQTQGSLQQQYAQRYGLSRSSFSSTSDRRSPVTNRRECAGSGDALDRELQGLPPSTTTTTTTGGSKNYRLNSSYGNATSNNPYADHMNNGDGLEHQF